MNDPSEWKKLDEAQLRQQGRGVIAEYDRIQSLFYKLPTLDWKHVVFQFQHDGARTRNYLNRLIKEDGFHADSFMNTLWHVYKNFRLMEWVLTLANKGESG